MIGLPPREGWKKEREMRESVNNMVMEADKTGMKMMVNKERMMIEWVYKVYCWRGEEMMRIKMLREDKMEEIEAKWMEKIDKVKRIGWEERDKGG